MILSQMKRSIVKPSPSSKHKIIFSSWRANAISWNTKKQRYRWVIKLPSAKFDKNMPIYKIWQENCHNKISNLMRKKITCGKCWQKSERKIISWANKSIRWKWSWEDCIRRIMSISILMKLREAQIYWKKSRKKIKC